MNPWIPHKPHPKPTLFLLHDDWREGLYGGAAGGAKSETLLAAAAQYVDVPGYAALLLRKTFRDLDQPDALIPRSKNWWMGKAHWNGQDKRWTFPSGATITFGYLDHADDMYQYDSSAFQFIGFDELRQFQERPYRYLASRLRKPVDGPLASIPLRLRGATNPGGIGHQWIKNRFLPLGFSSQPEWFSRPWYVGKRFFVPARLEDNPTLNREAYIESLGLLDPVTLAQLLEGNWDVYEGGRFRREWFTKKYVDGGDAWRLEDTGEVFRKVECSVFAIMDPAASEKESADYTVTGFFALTPTRKLLVLEIVRLHLPIDQIVPRLWLDCQTWNPDWVGIEGVGAFAAIVKQAEKYEGPHQGAAGLPPIRTLTPEGKSKLVKATPAIVACEGGQVYLPHLADWVEEFVSELIVFTGDDKKDPYDDQVDVLSYGVIHRDSYVEQIEPFSLGSKAPWYGGTIT